ncbi:DNA glycosylase [Lojkania enalia]|uniref:Adenine DNA glycosylase n=1 Tax=Lojkania enalia TaxID=147567 RepID=A0A9P4N8Q1_9PLEO|nr:DNA glycosylase [Didymosphaeria enalia]
MPTRRKNAPVVPILDVLPSLGIPEPKKPKINVVPLARVHAASYHWPLLLNDDEACRSLLKWFEDVQEERQMPWRKKWIDYEGLEGGEGKKALARRAYEVWVSEIMLQQTRVSTVIPYFNKWISKWPTIQDLAIADHDEVLSAWKGLGYYSRATRLHQGARAMVERNGGACPIPSGAEQLQQFPGIGKYTAGAISSIAFGEAEPVLDGNLVRVLSRQLGLYVDREDKKSNDFLWRVADRLVKNASGFPKIKRSMVPGQWNQALMELGSTLCTPRPRCDQCPIRRTCQAYAEAKKLLQEERVTSNVPDIEDACSYCEQLNPEDVDLPDNDPINNEARTAKKRKREVKTVRTMSHYFATGMPRGPRLGPSASTDGRENEIAVLGTNGSSKRKTPISQTQSTSLSAYCSLFPKKVAKKRVAEEECVVCIVELRLDGGRSKWLIEQRPAKGLLASLWQFPQCTLPKQHMPSIRKASAKQFVAGLNPGNEDFSARYLCELGSLTHVFSHLKLTMHVHSFKVDADTSLRPEPALSGPLARKWVDTEAMDQETLSTGMRRCWALIRDSLSHSTTP